MPIPTKLMTSAHKNSKRIIMVRRSLDLKTYLRTEEKSSIREVDLEYNEKVLAHFYEPQNVGYIEGADGVGKLGDASCAMSSLCTLR